MHDDSAGRHDEDPGICGASRETAAICPVVGIGASAGGFEAFREFLSAVPADCGLAFVLVQHLDPNHESMLAQLLTKATELPVRQIEDGSEVAPGRVYLIPPNASLTIEAGRLRLAPFSEPRGFRRPIDVFFRSLAEDQGSNAACIVLSGTGSDGMQGLRAVKEAGGLTLVQDPETARYDGMPSSAASTGLVDHVLAAGEMAACLGAYFGRAAGDPLAGTQSAGHDPVEEITGLLRGHVGHDFGRYKRSTLTRRIARRMQVVGAPDAQAYIDRLKDDAAEAGRLFHDLLINVTSFFRDPQAFALLREKIIPSLLESRTAAEQVRVWVPGCSSGEEAYSIAMLLHEALRGRRGKPSVCVLASDIDERMLAIARRGVYSESAVRDIPDALRDGWLVAGENGWMVSQTLRDSVRFSSHSLIKDPPFSRIDLVSCRNLLIYFSAELQARLLPLFHYALRPGGFLFLGPSENIAGRADLFRTIEGSARLYRRRDGRSVPLELPLEAELRWTRPRPPEQPSAAERRSRGVARRMLERYTPPHVLVDGRGTVLHASGRTGPYLELAPGAPTNALLDLARSELKRPLAALLAQVESSGRPAGRPAVGIETPAGLRSIDLLAEPMPDDTVLLVFQEIAGRQEGAGGAAPLPPDGPGSLPADGSDSRERHLENRAFELEQELEDTGERLRTTLEELETSNEELRSSNEEMMSMNEELQSTNEELSTVNEELKNKLDELARANSDLQNFLESTRLAVVFVDRGLKVRAFTPDAQEIFHLREQDRGRPLGEIASKVAVENLAPRVHEVVQTLQQVEEEVVASDGTGRRFVLRILPYRSTEESIEGAVLTFTDVTRLRDAEAQAAVWQDRYERAADAAGQLLYVYDLRERRIAFSGAVEAVTGYRPEELAGPVERWLALLEEGDRPALTVALDASDRGTGPSLRRYRLRTKDGQIRHCEDLGHVLERQDGRTVRVIGLVADVTARHRLEEMQAQLMHELQHRVKNTLATVRALVRQTAKDSPSVEALESSLSGRIEALARTHSLLTEANWRHVGLRRIVEQELAPYSGGVAAPRLAIEGPEILLPPRQALTLSMALHELATNAAKHGVLSGEAGRLSLAWRIEPACDGRRRVELAWQETDGPPVAAPSRRGFGLLLLERGVPRDLNGEVDLALPPEGLRCTIAFELPPEAVPQEPPAG
ncbi:chemotaxis protein CheB [Marinimicrococcus flavescens]|uniref:Chemotaxis protein CheB n=1 Tax=Marinimicrococcus flavescens TaxID=3031815 RepID=A0AAP3XQ04_9PROT|nr:chemotaxis protein CheB [Marinimicrococcus flavescens]